jgi:hypothetical protein
MNRKEMEQVIAEGGSVLYEGRIITKAKDLPDAADLAIAGAEDPDATAESLDAQIKALQEKKAALVAAQKAKAKEQPQGAAGGDGGGDGTSGKSTEENKGGPQGAAGGKKADEKK